MYIHTYIHVHTYIHAHSIQFVHNLVCTIKLGILLLVMLNLPRKTSAPAAGATMKTGNPSPLSCKSLKIVEKFKRLY